MRYTRLTVTSRSILTGSSVHAYLLHGAVPTLVDAPPGGTSFIADVERALQDAGDDSLAQVIVTHAHADHVGGVGDVHLRWPSAVFRKRPPVSTATPGGEGFWQILDGEPMLPAGAGQLWAISTPGHAPDHVCLLDVHAGVLFAGDLAINGSTVTIPVSAGGNLREYLHSVRKVLDLQPRLILPAHGDPITQPSALLRGYLSHRLMREQQILEALAAGIGDPDAIVERLYAATAVDLWPAARENVLAHLHKLRDDGRVECADELWQLRS